MRGSLTLLTSLCLLLTTTLAHAQWGDLTAKFVVDRTVPRQPIVGAKLPPELLGVILLDDSLIVGPEAELKNVVVWLQRAADDKVPIHPDYEDPSPVELEIKDCAFDPHVLAVRVGQKLTVQNRDPVANIVKFDLLMPVKPLAPAVIKPKESADFKFAAAEGLATPMGNAIFPWMSGYIIIRDDPYVAISGNDGTLKLKNIPAGDWTFTFWHERCGYIKKPALAGKEVDWPKGRVSVTIRDGETTDLGTAVISAESLKKK